MSPQIITINKIKNRIMRNKIQNLLFLVIGTALSASISSCSEKTAEATDAAMPNEEKVLTIFDGDPGTDDAYCLFLASKVLTDIEPDYCVATFGNSTGENTRRNTAILNKYLGMKSQLVLGAEKPFNGIEPSCGDFHGTDGLAELQSSMLERYGITDENISKNLTLEQLKDSIKAADKVNYIAVGPLTSLATLIKDPEVEKKIDWVYAMGGGIDYFNKDIGTFNTEYNFAGDGQAVVDVFNSKLNILLAPYDFTRAKFITPEQIDEFAAVGTYPEMIQILNCNKASNARTGQANGAILHDIFPLLYLSNESAFTTKDEKLTADAHGHIERNANGRTVRVLTDIQDQYHQKLIKEAFMTGK